MVARRDDDVEDELRIVEAVAAARWVSGDAHRAAHLTLVALDDAALLGVSLEVIPEFR